MEITRIAIFNFKFNLPSPGPCTNFATNRFYSAATFKFEKRVTVKLLLKTVAYFIIVMALTPCLGRDSSFYRSRSSSFSSPTARNFVYQEMVEIGDNTMIRSYSCGQVFTTGQDGETLQSTQVSVMNFVSPSKNFKTGKLEGEPKFWSVPKKLPIAYRENLKPVKSRSALKFYEPEKAEKTVSDRESKKYFDKLRRILKKTVYLNIIILSLLSANCAVKYMHCNQNWRTEELVNSLKQSVFGQQELISNLRSLINDFTFSNENWLINFSGGTGVGKTHVSSIIYNHFPWETNKHVYYFDLLTEEVLLTASYSSCGSNLIIIDGMNVTNAETAIKMIEKVMITLNKNVKLLVILVFQTHGRGEQQFIGRLGTPVATVRHIPFNDLTEQDVRHCFHTEIKRQNKIVSQEYLNNLVLEQMKFSNISRSLPGCKNVFHEVSRLPHHS